MSAKLKLCTYLYVCTVQPLLTCSIFICQIKLWRKKKKKPPKKPKKPKKNKNPTYQIQQTFAKSI